MMHLLIHLNRLWRWLQNPPRSPQFDPVQLPVNLLDAWDAPTRLSDNIHYHGTYQILDYDAPLAIKDPKGLTAILTQPEVIRLLLHHTGASNLMPPASPDEYSYLKNRTTCSPITQTSPAHPSRASRAASTALASQRAP